VIRGDGHPFGGDRATDLLDRDEFALLDQEAGDLGVRLARPPVVRRKGVRTPDGEVSAVVWGGRDPELVLLHGGGLNARTWDGVLLALDRPAVAIDLPGHGHSSWRADGRYDPEVIAVAVGEAVTVLAPRARAVVGQSLGGLTTIALGGLRPGLVRRQILVDAIPAEPMTPDNPVGSFLGGPDSFASRDEIVERAISFGLGGGRSAVERAVTLNTVQRDDGRWTWRRHIGQRPNEVSISPDFRPLWSLLEGYGGAITLIRGSRGFVDEDQVAELQRRIPAVDVTTVETGHNVQEEDPVGLAQLLEGLLSG
jgi:pimeloyl-ACP methyl ester carboxylesterase